MEFIKVRELIEGQVVSANFKVTNHFRGRFCERIGSFDLDKISALLEGSYVIEEDQMELDRGDRGPPGAVYLYCESKGICIVATAGGDPLNPYYNLVTVYTDQSVRWLQNFKRKTKKRLKKPIGDFLFEQSLYVTALNSKVQSIRAVA